MIFLWPMVKHVRLQTCTVYEESIECVSVNLEVSQKSDYWEPCTRSWTKNGLSTFQTFGFVTQVLKYHILSQNKPILRGVRKNGFFSHGWCEKRHFLARLKEREKTRFSRAGWEKTDGEKKRLQAVTHQIPSIIWNNGSPKYCSM